MNTHPKFEPGDRVAVKQSRGAKIVGVVQSVHPSARIHKNEHVYMLAGGSHLYPESQLEIHVKQNALDRHADKLRQEFLDLIGYEDG